MFIWVYFKSIFIWFWNFENNILLWNEFIGVIFIFIVINRKRGGVFIWLGIRWDIVLIKMYNLEYLFGMG